MDPNFSLRSRQTLDDSRARAIDFVAYRLFRRRVFFRASSENICSLGVDRDDGPRRIFADENLANSP